MPQIQVMFDPITNKPYNYSIDTAREKHLIKVLSAVCANQCPTSNKDYLCEKEDAIEGDELIQCAKCYKLWAEKVVGADTLKAQKLLDAINMTACDNCPPNTKDRVCLATEDSNTDEETCALCIQRWATIPFATFRK